MKDISRGFVHLTLHWFDVVIYTKIRDYSFNIKQKNSEVSKASKF